MDESILIVDDDEEMRLSMRRALKHRGYTIFAAAHAEEALAMVAAHPEIQLVVSDMCMPGMDGMALLEAAKQKFSALPIVLVTAHGTVQNAIAALKAGARDYLLKPFSNAQLLKTVEDALVGSRGVWQGNSQRTHHKLQAPPMLSKDEVMLQVWDTVGRVAKSGATVMISGESGVGKEVAARHIHLLSPRRTEPFVAINCAAIPENLLESEFFGFTKGSFTGAHQDKAGKFEIAGRGTLLLDEVSEMPLALQSKLLRVLQEKEFFSIGGRTAIKMEARLIATTNRDLSDWVRQGQFREDLYYRLNVIPLQIPPLRQRRQDIPVLCQFFIDQFNVKNPAYPVSFAEEALHFLQLLPWPGNIRELENSITRIALLSGHSVITGEDCRKYIEARPLLGSVSSPGPEILKTLDEFEIDIILKTIDKMSGNRTRAAEALGITTRTLRNKLSKWKMVTTTLSS